MSDEYRQGQRTGWRSTYSGYGATIANEPGYANEQFAGQPMFQQPYPQNFQQPFQPQGQHAFTHTSQQPFIQPFIQQPYSYNMPLQQPIQPGFQQPPIQPAYGLQPQFQQPFVPQFQPSQIPQQPIGLGLTHQFPQQLQQQHFALQPLPQHGHLPQQPSGYLQPTPPLGFNPQFQQQSQLGLSRAGRYMGRGPKNYRRPDERIREDAMERLTTHPDIDATNVDITVKNSEIILKGTVEDRIQKRLVEDICESVFGVVDVQNQLRVEPTAWDQFQHTAEGELASSTKNKEK